jgi:hypothetical protein
MLLRKNQDTHTRIYAQIRANKSHDLKFSFSSTAKIRSEHFDKSSKFGKNLRIVSAAYSFCGLYSVDLLIRRIESACKSTWPQNCTPQTLF